MSIEKEMLLDVRPEKEGMYVDQQLAGMAPGLPPSFRSIDEAYRADPRQFLEEAIGRVEQIKVHDTGQEATCSFIYDEKTAEASEALVVFAPSPDVAPKGSIGKLLRLLRTSPGEISMEDLMRVHPRTYRQALRSKTTHDLLKMQFHGMPVITIFDPINPGVYNRNERAQFRSGDFSPAERLVTAAVSEFQDHLLGPGGSRISRVHLNGSGLGASNARGAAAGMLYSSGLQLGSYTGQEMMIGPDKFLATTRLRGRLALKRQSEASDTVEASSERPKVRESQLGRELQERGDELQALGQFASDMFSQTYIKGLTRSHAAINDLINLDKAGIPVTLACATDSGVTKETKDTLCIEGFRPPFAHQQRILVRAVEGERIGHELNDLVVPSATIALAGVLHAASRQ
jgi:hypothetical protein